jgi:hypothetical protein
VLGAKLAFIDPVVERVPFIPESTRCFGKVYQRITALRLGAEFADLADEFEVALL